MDSFCYCCYTANLAEKVANWDHPKSTPCPKINFIFYLFINIWGIPQQGIGLPWSRGSPNNVDDMHEQVMPVLVNVSECKREAWCWEWDSTLSVLAILCPCVHGFLPISAFCVHTAKCVCVCVCVSLTIHCSFNWFTYLLSFQFHDLIFHEVEGELLKRVNFVV